MRNVILTIIAAAAILSNPAAAQEDTSEMQLQARAMFIKIPVEEFNEFEIVKDELKFPEPMDIAKMLIKSDEAELLTSADAIISSTGKKANVKYNKTYYMPVIQKSPNRQITDIRYENYEEILSWYLFASKKENEIALSYEFIYSWYTHYPNAEDTNTRKIPDANSFSQTAEIPIEINKTFTASYKKDGDNYLILLMNISDK